MAFLAAENRVKIVLKNFRMVDEDTDTKGSLVIENGLIAEVLDGESCGDGAAIVIDGGRLSPRGNLPVLMPAFVDLHAHFRECGLHEKEAPFPAELIESASLSAATGGFGTVVCMANTKPPADTVEKAAAVKSRSDALGLIDLYPALSLTKNMEGKELSEITRLSPDGGFLPLMISEDGKDLADKELFLGAMKEAKRLGIIVSCHCDFGGNENNAVRRVIELGKKAGCRVHIDHVSTKESVETIREAKAAEASNGAGGFRLTCEATPHNLCLTKEDAVKLGEKTWGRVSPPLGSEEDRQALIKALADGTIDAIATDQAPHSAADKNAGAPGFSGFETAFSAVYTALFHDTSGVPVMSLKKLSSLMSANPARLLGFGDGPKKRGLLLPGHRADLVIVDTEASWTVTPDLFKSRGKNSPFIGRRLYGKILMTLYSGRVAFG